MSANRKLRAENSSKILHREKTSIFFGRENFGERRRTFPAASHRFHRVSNQKEKTNFRSLLFSALQKNRTNSADRGRRNRYESRRSAFSSESVFSDARLKCFSFLCFNEKNKNNRTHSNRRLNFFSVTDSTNVTTLNHCHRQTHQEKHFSLVQTEKPNQISFVKSLFFRTCSN